ncbi:YtxH domain-containing protein [Virgibacillus ndiopensis]|uniref:YtxH domain-containing protein n=1 Tax=Virgibacillus ndiopensis TaxID=2004408 RepID=UPI000C06BBDD|nr:YtxH domain-containing protein [Virgibacillus ndiopensis]
MGKNKLCLGMLIGAIVGGVTALCDRETRNYTKYKMSGVKRQANYYLKHPSEAVRNAQTACNQFNESFNSGANNAINALEQVEDTMNKITKKKDPKKIESTM